MKNDLRIWNGNIKNIEHAQLIKRVILKHTSSSIALLTMCISQCCHNRVLYWFYTDPYCFIYWAIRENIAPAARPIRKINTSNIALPGKTILEVYLLEIENVCIMTQVRIYGEIQTEPSGISTGSDLRISLVLRLYFTVYPFSCHNTNTLFRDNPFPEFGFPFQPLSPWAFSHRENKLDFFPTKGTIYLVAMTINVYQATMWPNKH